MLIRFLFRVVLTGSIVGLLLIAFYGIIWLPFIDMMWSTLASPSYPRSYRFGHEGVLGGLIYLAAMAIPVFVGIGLVYGFSGAEEYFEQERTSGQKGLAPAKASLGEILMLPVHIVLWMSPILWVGLVIAGGYEAQSFMNACVWGDTCSDYRFDMFG